MPRKTRHAARFYLLPLLVLVLGTTAILAVRHGARAQAQATSTPDAYDRDWIDAVISDLILGIAANQGRYDLLFGDGGSVAEPPRAAELRACLGSEIASSTSPHGANHIEVLGTCMVRVDPLGQLSEPPAGRPVDLTWGPETVDSLAVWLVGEALPGLIDELGPRYGSTFIAASAIVIDGGQVQRCVTAYGLLGVSRSRVEDACKSMLLLEEIREAASLTAPPPTPEPLLATAPSPSPTPVPTPVPGIIPPMTETAPSPTPRPTPRLTATPSPSPPARTCNLSGRWSGSTTNWGGRWDLTQQGASVTGTFPGSSPSYAGEVQGTVSGNRLTGTWRWTGVQSSRGQGDFEYTISEDCRRLTGRMRIGSSGAWFNDSLQRQ